MPLIINPHFAILYLYLSLFFVLFIYLVFGFCFLFLFLLFLHEYLHVLLYALCGYKFKYAFSLDHKVHLPWVFQTQKRIQIFYPTLGRYLISADATIFLVSLGFSVKRVDS